MWHGLHVGACSRHVICDMVLVACNSAVVPSWEVIRRYEYRVVDEGRTTYQLNCCMGRSWWQWDLTTRSSAVSGSCLMTSSEQWTVCLRNCVWLKNGCRHWWQWQSETHSWHMHQPWDHSQDLTRKTSSRPGGLKKSVKESKENQSCFYCGKIVHLKKDRRKLKTDKNKSAAIDGTDALSVDNTRGSVLSAVRMKHETCR